jgi:hypothetical protein
MDENQVLSAFEASMGQAEAPETPAAKPETEAAQVEGADAPQAEETEKPEVKAEEVEETETIEIDPDAPLFEQEVEEDGKKIAQKLSLKELQQGYLRDRDYRRKTQELARQREELPKLVAKQGQELSESYSRRLGELQLLVMKTVAEELHGKDLNALANEDPFEYVRVSNRERQIRELQQSIEKEMADVLAKKQENEQILASQKWQKSLEILHRDIPDFGPPVVKRLIDVGEEWGFSKDEVSQWTDHRLVKMLHALSEKKAIETKRPEVEKKVAVVTKVLKPGQPSKARSANDEARTRFRKSGKLEDGLGVFENFV